MGVVVETQKPGDGKTYPKQSRPPLLRTPVEISSTLPPELLFKSGDHDIQDLNAVESVMY
jgi:hypothetical protein